MILHLPGKSGDEGIEGIINEYRLCLDRVYLQANKWKKDSIIGCPEIQKFVVALMDRRTKNGVYIATAGFSKEAANRSKIEAIEEKIVLANEEH